MTATRPMLLSLRPRFADAILAGRKTVEVRRRPMLAPEGTQIILYATAPRKAVVGMARLAAVSVVAADQAWREHGRLLGLEQDELDRYLGGALAHLMLLADVTALSDPVSLASLRADASAFRPPRSFRYLSSADPTSITGLVDPSNGIPGGGVSSIGHPSLHGRLAHALKTALAAALETASAGRANLDPPQSTTG